MKVLHLNDHYDTVGGAEVILHQTLEALEKDRVTNVVAHQHPTSIREKRWPLYRIAGLGDAVPAKGRNGVEELHEIVRTEQPDLIHLYDVGNPDIARACREWRPAVQSVLNHSFYCPGGMKYLPFLGRICQRPFGAGCLASAFLTHCNSIQPKILLSSYQRSRRMLRETRGLIFLTLSRYQAQRLRQSGCPPETVRVLPPFTDLPDLSSRSEPAFGEPLLLLTGRLFPEKGLDMLLKALRSIKTPCRLVVDGAGPALGRARWLAAGLGLGRRVAFVGWAPPEQHRQYYRQASVVIVPSIWPEPFGLVGIEAMSYGKPVVAFNVGGIPEWLDDGATGFLIRPYDVEEMAKKIAYLLGHPDVAHQMGMRGRRRVEEDFTEEKHIARLLEVYQEVVGNRSGS